MKWNKGEIGFDRTGHFRIIKNNGKDVTATYISGGQDGGEKLFKVGDTNVQRIHDNILLEYKNAYQVQVATALTLKNKKPGASPASALGGL